MTSTAAVEMTMMVTFLPLRRKLLSLMDQRIRNSWRRNLMTVSRTLYPRSRLLAKKHLESEMRDTDSNS